MSLANQIAGRKGGLATASKGREYMSVIGKLGGRPRKTLATSDSIANKKYIKGGMLSSSRLSFKELRRLVKAEYGDLLGQL